MHLLRSLSLSLSLSLSGCPPLCLVIFAAMDFQVLRWIFQSGIGID
ncbi:hypothetical protein RchiOBHm_Chr2g0089751 [Rosa chinensis]|uniref:Uncharacterized protein n=1 Tax=Rosa chinensis TaxID=74649 RepID=A0A2P6RJB3_ROSCH|nr:hypothetical protein RchiOBHm_Chr2g0089751 [Rosa chinensis]